MVEIAIIAGRRRGAPWPYTRWFGSPAVQARARRHVSWVMGKRYPGRGNAPWRWMATEWAVIRALWAYERKMRKLGKRPSRYVI